VNLYVVGGIGAQHSPSERFRGSLQNLNQSNLDHVSIQYSVQMQRKAVGYVLATMGRRAR
jgi:hypothetical protein